MKTNQKVICIVGIGVIVLGLAIATIPLPDNVIERGRVVLKLAEQKYNKGLISPEQWQKDQQKYIDLQNTRPYLMEALILCVIGLVTICIAVAIGLK